MRRFLWLLLLVLGAQAAVLRQNVSFSAGQFKLAETDGYALVLGTDMDVTDEPGMPQLPVLPQSIELPGRCKVVAVRVSARGWGELASGLVVQPAQRQVPFSVVSGLRATEPDLAVYNSERPFPSYFWRWTGTGTRNGRTLVDLILYPVRYFGAEKKLQYCRGFDIEVEYELDAGRPDFAFFSPLLFDYVVVTAREYDSVFGRLTKWKTEKGVRAVIRHIDWVYANYPGRDNAEKLRNYLKTLPDSGVRYVLLGGDVSVIPFRKAYAMTSEGRLHPREDSLPCDLYFADLDGNWDRNGNNVFGEVADSVDLYPDIWVGRAPVDNLGEARAFVNKVLEYERGGTQVRHNRALFFAEVMWSDPYTDGGVHKNRLEALAFRTGYEITKLYQSLGNESRVSVMQAIREGQNYLNHDGHGWIDVMSVGGYPNYLRTRDADTITNAYRGVIYSIGCWTTAFDTVSIGEAFVTNPNGGTVATIGNSSYGWGSPGNPGFGYSEKFDDRFWFVVQRGSAGGIGSALAQAKAFFVPFSREENVYRWHQYQVNLMGDPEMPVWTAIPDTLTVHAPSQIPVAASRVLVTVSAKGRAVRGARVCLMKKDESYAVAYTNAAGEAWLTVEPHTAGDFLLTVTARNFLPWQITIPSTQDSYLNFTGWVVDDSLGNNDGVVNENEIIRLGVWLHNAGSVPLGPMPLLLKTDDTVVTVVDSVAFTPALQPGDSVFLVRAFQLYIHSCADDGRLLRFELLAGQTGNQRSFYPLLQLGLPRLVLKRHFYTNPPGRPSQTKGLKVVIDNVGHGFSHRTWARLISRDPNIVVLEPDSISLDRLSPGSRNVSTDSFQVTITGSCPEPCLSEMRLDLWCDGYAFSYPLRLLVGDYGFADNMESGPGKWTYGGNGSGWHLSSYRSRSGTWSWYCGDSVTRRYSRNTNAWLTTTPFLVAESCTLRFWRWFNVPNYGVDGIYVIIVRKDRADTLDFIGTGGALYQGAFSVEDGIESDWLEEVYDLSFLAVGETVQVKFGFKSDNDADVGEGFYLDDVVVTGGTPPPTCIAEPITYLSDQKVIVSPNPFRHSVTLHGAGREAIVRIFDVFGRQVRTLFSSCPAGLVWNGCDETGRRVPAGSYFVELRQGDEIRIARVLLVR